MPELSDKAIDILMQEYASLREEIKERLKIAFSHVAYAGAIAAFVLPAADKLSGWGPRPLTFVCAAVALFGLGWVAYLNMRWVQHCGVRIRKIEEKINGRFGMDVLGWEQYASGVQASRWFRIPVAAPRPQSVDGPPGSGAAATKASPSA
jgi:hypothetical protein